MNLTEEQKIIIKSIPKYNSIKVEALAGTGKTTVLYEIAKKYKNKKFLYLAFNNSIVKEVKNKMPDNVDCLTIHGLAFKYTKNTLKLIKRNIRTNFRIIEVKDALRCRTYDEAVITKELFDAFTISRYKNIDTNVVRDLIKYKKYLIPKLIKTKINEDKIVSNIQKLWNLIYENKLGTPHNFYLKFFHVNIKYFAKYIDYDYLLCDEFQDSNYITMDIIQSIKAQKIYIGDIFQSIYMWNDAINALNIIEAEKTLYLTNTFRNNKTITDKANIVLDYICGYHKKLVPHFPNKTGDINIHAYITRTNSALIELLDMFKNEGVKTLRKPDGIFELPLSLYYFSLNPYQHKDKITTKWLFSFSNITEVEKYANMNQDVELISALKIVSKYNYKLIDLFEFAKKQYRKRKNIKIILTTAHTSKGLEFDKVTIWNDFPNLLENIVLKEGITKLDDLYKLIQNNSEYNKTVEEINLYYVALTRAKFELNDFTINNNIIINNTKENIEKELLEIKNKKNLRHI